MDKGCKTCTHDGVDQKLNKEPCATCVKSGRSSEWNPKGCDNCKHRTKAGGDEPCATCFGGKGYPMWEPIPKDSELKPKEWSCETCGYVDINDDNGGCWSPKDCVNGSEWAPKMSDIAALESESDSEPQILDSGERREFESGAVRDMAEGKGRCDLMPLDIIAYIAKMDVDYYRRKLERDKKDPVMNCEDRFLISIYYYQTQSHIYDVKSIVTAIGYLLAESEKNKFDILLDLAKHYEKGAKKYGERNWERGLPESSYLDSSVRHYLKWKAGWTDEPHYTVCLWNLVALWWTHDNLAAEESEESE